MTVHISCALASVLAISLAGAFWRCCVTPAWERLCLWVDGLHLEWERDDAE